MPASRASASAAPARDASERLRASRTATAAAPRCSRTSGCSEPKPPDDPDSPLAFSMESGPQAAAAAAIPFFWSPGWNSIQSVNKFQAEVGGPLRGGDPGVRLVELRTGSIGLLFRHVRQPSVADAANWLIVPMLPHFRFGRAEPARAGSRRTVAAALCRDESGGCRARWRQSRTKQWRFRIGGPASRFGRAATGPCARRRRIPAGASAC